MRERMNVVMQNQGTGFYRLSLPSLPSLPEKTNHTSVSQGVSSGPVNIASSNVIKSTRWVDKHIITQTTKTEPCAFPYKNICANIPSPVTAPSRHITLTLPFPHAPASAFLPIQGVDAAPSGMRESGGLRCLLLLLPFPSLRLWRLYVSLFFCARCVVGIALALYSTAYRFSLSLSFCCKGDGTKAKAKCSRVAFSQ